MSQYSLRYKWTVYRPTCEIFSEQKINNHINKIGLCQVLSTFFIAALHQYVYCTFPDKSNFVRALSTIQFSMTLKLKMAS